MSHVAVTKVDPKAKAAASRWVMDRPPPLLPTPSIPRPLCIRVHRHFDIPSILLVDCLLPHCCGRLVAGGGGRIERPARLAVRQCHTQHMQISWLGRLPGCPTIPGHSWLRHQLLPGLHGSRPSIPTARLELSVQLQL